MDDLISRAAAMVAAIEAADKWDGGYNVRRAHMIEDAIKALPSAQPERKRGQWIERNPKNSPECRLIECSECGNAYIVNMDLLLEDWAEGRNFCIRCGADMRGDGNEAD